MLAKVVYLVHLNLSHSTSFQATPLCSAPEFAGYRFLPRGVVEGAVETQPREEVIHPLGERLELLGAEAINGFDSVLGVCCRFGDAPEAVAGFVRKGHVG